jgi:hypothetical protein
MNATTETRIGSLLRTKSRFLRSAHLERDFHDPDVFSGYVVTDFTRSCLERMAKGLAPQSGQRAWRLTGDYGSGKSSFALLFAHWFAGNDSSFPPEIRAKLNLNQLAAPHRRLVPTLVTCTRDSLVKSILKALRETLVELGKLRSTSTLVAEIDLLLKAKHEPDDNPVIDLILKANSSIIANSKGKGLLLVIDELGKFLEFAAINPQRQDVFFLQRLAEAACRSQNEPLFVVCLLHQGFSDYADHLNQLEQREWEKVAGRFEQLIFNQPLEEITQLIASALHVQTDLIPQPKAKGLKEAMSEAVELGWFGTAASKALVKIAPYLYPLHPTVIPILVRTFRRFGQNERSLFSFLLSSEPFGLQAFAEKRLQDSEPYCLHDLYDYVRTSFGHKLAGRSYRSHWNLIDSVIESFATDDELLVNILKTVGILNLLNDTDLLATENAVICAIAGHNSPRQKQVKLAIAELHKHKRVLYDRGRARGLCLWPHTSVDLEKAYEDACRAVDTPKKVADLIGDYLETRPIVARRHYIETGNLRHYAVRYCSVRELPDLLEEGFAEADGVLIIPLCETQTERSDALAFTRLPELKQRRNWLVAVPQALSNLASLLQEVQRWGWVLGNVPELNADKYAREEASRQKEAARAQLEKRVQILVGIKQFGLQTSLEWFHQGVKLRIKNGRDLLSKLSCIFDEVYSLAPQIHNELINRRNLSSAAAGARMRLIERMFTNASAPFLGMNPKKKPPEMSMYLSVLRETGLHRQHGEPWWIAEPPHQADQSQILPVMDRIRDIVQKQTDSRVSIALLFEELRKPPYGVRDGIIPLLLTAFAVSHDSEIAFYKDGTFLREMNGEAMLVLTKAPEIFEIQHCKIAGVRSFLFEKLIAALELERSNKNKVELLDVVKPLCVFVAQLPAYVLNTKKLSSLALAVREAILDAREPATLVFTALPNACGFESVSTKQTKSSRIPAFVGTLKAALEELRTAYPELQQRLRERLREAFVMLGSFHKFRTALAMRAGHILLTITEPKLRAFCLRLMDDNLPESDWLESLGSYLTLKPPSKWHDAEEDAFNTQLAELAARFHRVEAIAFADGKMPKGTVGVRLAITQLNGMEHEEVVHFTIEEEHQLLDLQKQFETLLADDKRLGLAAASRAIWKSLDNGNKLTND